MGNPSIRLGIRPVIYFIRSNLWLVAANYMSSGLGLNSPRRVRSPIIRAGSTVTFDRNAGEIVDEVARVFKLVANPGARSQFCVPFLLSSDAQAETALLSRILISTRSPRSLVEAVRAGSYPWLIR